MVQLKYSLYSHLLTKKFNIGSEHMFAIEINIQVYFFPAHLRIEEMAEANEERNQYPDLPDKGHYLSRAVWLTSDCAAPGTQPLPSLATDFHYLFNLS